MSVDASSWAWKQKGLGHAVKMTLLALADIADTEGQCWPKRKSLADMLECSVDTIDRHMRELMSLGLIEKEHRQLESGASTSNMYRLMMPLGEGRKSTALGPHSRAARGPHSSAAQGAAYGAAPIEPLIEPSLNIVAAEAAPKPSKKAAKAKARTSLSEEWKLGDSDRQYALSEGVPAARLEREAQRFRDHHISKGSLMADWSAAWRTWVGNYLKWNPSTEPVSQDSEQAKWAALYEFFDKTGRWREAAYGPAPYTPGHRGPRKQQPQQALI